MSTASWLDTVLTMETTTPTAPTVYGVGYVEDKLNIRLYKLAYITWKDVLRRCYSPTYKGGDSSYVHATVAPEWHTFEAFAKWHQEHYIAGYALDKDLLSDDNKIYSPETCIYIDATLNNILHKGSGTHYNKRAKKYTAQITINGRKKHLGYYPTAKLANRAYAEAKRAFYMRLARSGKYNKVISDRLKVLAKRF